MTETLTNREKEHNERIELFNKCDFRVGKILECSVHPDSDKLYIERIDIGEQNDWQIVSGLQ